MSSRSLRSGISLFRSRKAAARKPGASPETPSSLSSSRRATPSSATASRPATPSSSSSWASAPRAKPLTVAPAIPQSSLQLEERPDFAKSKENVTVTVRFLPLSAREINKGDEIAWYADGDFIVRNKYNQSIAYGFGLQKKQQSSTYPLRQISSTLKRTFLGLL